MVRWLDVLGDQMVGGRLVKHSWSAGVGVGAGVERKVFLKLQLKFRR